MHRRGDVVAAHPPDPRGHDLEGARVRGRHVSPDDPHVAVAVLPRVLVPEADRVADLVHDHAERARAVARGVSQVHELSPSVVADVRRADGLPGRLAEGDVGRLGRAAHEAQPRLLPHRDRVANAPGRRDAARDRVGDDPARPEPAVAPHREQGLHGASGLVHDLVLLVEHDVVLEDQLLADPHVLELHLRILEAEESDPRLARLVPRAEVAGLDRLRHRAAVRGAERQRADQQPAGLASRGLHRRGLHRRVPPWVALGNRRAMRAAATEHAGVRDGLDRWRPAGAGAPACSRPARASGRGLW